MSHLTLERQTTLRTLYAILFTEIAVFLFEDATMLNIWIFRNETYDATDLLDQSNAWTALISILLGAIVLLAAVFASLKNWTWKPGCCPKIAQLGLASFFVLLFGIVFTFLLTTLYFGFQTIVKGESTMEGGLMISVCLS